MPDRTPRWVTAVPIVWLSALGCSRESPAAPAALALPQVASAAVPGGFWDLAATDVDKDGRTDLLAVSGGLQSSTGALSVWLNPGTRAPTSEWKRYDFGPPDCYVGLAAGDIDGDGREDAVALTSTGVVHWWEFAADPALTHPADHHEVQIPADRVACADVQSLVWSSIALGDADGDGDLDLAATSYRANGCDTEVVLLRFDPSTHDFQAPVAWTRRSALHVRFLDVDGDDSLDLVTSAYHLKRPDQCGSSSGALSPPTVPRSVQWGQWWPLGDPHLPVRPLVAAFEPGLPDDADLSVIDFDALQTTGGLQFVLALSAHLCATSGCWEGDRAGGFVAVVDTQGKQHWVSDAAEAPREKARESNPRQYLVPRTAGFLGNSDDPLVVSSFWWTQPRNSGQCPRTRGGCAGPVLVASTEADTAGGFFDTDVLVQALVPGAFDAAASQTRSAKQCARRRILPLSHAVVSQIQEVAAADAGASVGYAWVSGSHEIEALAKDPNERVCAEYTAVTQPDLVAVGNDPDLHFITTVRSRARDEEE